MTETTRFRPDPSQLVLVVIDIQEKLAKAMPEAVLQSVAHNTEILIAAAKEFGFPILMTEQYPRGLGSTLEEIKAALGDPAAPTTPVEKLTFSCCHEPAFQHELEKLGKKDILLCGMECHVCVLQTTLDLLDEGRKVFIPADAVCSRSKQNWKLGIEAMRQAGAAIGSTEMFIFQMLERAGTERFKKFSRLFR